MTDEYDDDLPADPGVNIANGIVIVTGIVMLLAIYTMASVTADLYQTGWLAN
jgi:hypothetical protein